MTINLVEGGTLLAQWLRHSTNVSKATTRTRRLTTRVAVSRDQRDYDHPRALALTKESSDLGSYNI